MSAPCHRPPRTPDPERKLHSGVYVPRSPEESALYRTLADELETFLARRGADASPLPRFVVRELRGFLDCGVLAHGFLRVRCAACRGERLVPFSCKGRGFCPSCGGRRMASAAAWLVDRVIPEVPVRQWVLTLPHALRYRLAYDPALTSRVLAEFVRAIFNSMRRRARRELGIESSRCGAVTFVQRAGDALNLNVHFHNVAIDGVYAAGEDGAPVFYRLPPPDDDEIARVAARVARRIARVLAREGGESDGDPLAEREPWLAALAAASVRGRTTTGQRPLRLGDQVDPEAVDGAGDGQRRIPLCANVAGVGLHAGTTVPAHDRERLERLLRYAARPPLCNERLSMREDGRLVYRLKTRWRDGTTHVLFEPGDFVARLAALVPPRRFHILRYHGVLAPMAAWRPQIVPQVEVPEKRQSSPPAAGPPTSAQPPGATTRPRYYSWAELMLRVFAADVLECPKCRAPMRILAQIHPPDTTRAILECLGLSARPPPVAPARREPEEVLLPGWAPEREDEGPRRRSCSPDGRPNAKTKVPEPATASPHSAGCSSDSVSVERRAVSAGPPSPTLVPNPAKVRPKSAGALPGQKPPYRSTTREAGLGSLICGRRFRRIGRPQSGSRSLRRTRRRLLRRRGIDPRGGAPARSFQPHSSLYDDESRCIRACRS